MSVTVSSRVFWTQFDNLEYKDKSGKVVKIGKPAAKLVMLAIADSADDFGENSWQSFDTISEKASIERRSVIRVIRGLMAANYLSINGTSKYGTNDYKINMSLLGKAPERRAQNGRPKTSDSDAITSDSIAETSDSDAKTSDPESPYPSYNHPDSSNNPRKKGDLIDGMLEAAQMPGAKKMLVKQYIAERIKSKLGMNPSGKDAEAFIDYAANEHKKGNSFDKFLEWWIANNPKPEYWSFKRMEQMLPRAFLANAKSEPALVNGAFYA